MLAKEVVGATDEVKITTFKVNFDMISRHVEKVKTVKSFG
jgi:hypothetical protein